MPRSRWYPGVASETVADDVDCDWQRFENANGTVFEFVQHDCECSYGTLRGHFVPGSEELLGCASPLPDGGAAFGAEHQFDWGETVLQFFVDHPME